MILHVFGVKEHIIEQGYKVLQLFWCVLYNLLADLTDLTDLTDVTQK